MRRAAPILLLLGFLALGSGALEYLHNLEHAREDAEIAAAAVARGAPVQESPAHNDSNCPVHFQLHAPALAAGFMPLLICLGLFVRFLSLLSPAPEPHRFLSRIDCRGPPFC